MAPRVWVDPKTLDTQSEQILRKRWGERGRETESERERDGERRGGERQRDRDREGSDMTEKDRETPREALRTIHIDSPRAVLRDSSSDREKKDKDREEGDRERRDNEAELRVEDVF